MQVKLRYKQVKLFCVKDQLRTLMRKLMDEYKTCAKLCDKFAGFISENQLINVFTLTSTQLMTADV